MSTVRAPSAWLLWGALVLGGSLVLSGCSGEPVATGTVPPTSSGAATTGSTTALVTPPSVLPSASQAAENSTPTPPTPSEPTDPAPVLLTVPTDDLRAPEAIPTPTLEVPAGATQRTAGGAEDFLRWWFCLGSASAAAKSTAQLNRFASEDCTECAAQISALDSFISSDGQTYFEADFPWLQIVQAGALESDVITLVAVAHAPSTTTRDAQGVVIAETTARDFIAAFDIRWASQQGHWVVDRFREVSQ